MVLFRLPKPQASSICPLCFFTTVARKPPPPLITTPPWATQRLMSRIRGRGGADSRPSRMVLSDRVAGPGPPQTYSAGRTARLASRNRGDREERQDRQDPLAGPFGGMNRRVAPRGLRPPRPDPAVSKSLHQSPMRGRIPQGKERKALKMQKTLAEIPYARRARVKEGIKTIETFSQFDLLPSIQDAIQKDLLRGMTDIKPTPVQRLAIPALLGQSIGSFSRSRKDEFQSFLLAAETGSGKTMAYLLPTANAIKQAEAVDPDIIAFNKRRDEARKFEEAGKWKGRKFSEPHPTMARPKAIILVPSAELVEQIGSIAKMLSHEVKFKSEMLSATQGAKTIYRNVFGERGVDMIVATPHLLASIAQSDPNVLSRVTHLIVDEADSLFDRSFSPTTMEVLDKSMPSLKQLILCSATIPRRLDALLAERFPEMHRITTPNLHAVPRRVQMGVIDVAKSPYMNDKKLACHDALWAIAKETASHDDPSSDGSRVRLVLVFVNERETTQEVADYLAGKGVDAVALHRDTPETRQSDMLKLFTSSEKMTTPKDQPVKRRGLQNVKVLVATDLASRGIDTLAVRHVILYDVPHTTIDFIHRLGRAGRMGRRGRGIVLVDRKDRKDVVAEVKESMFMGQALI